MKKLFSVWLSLLLLLLLSPAFPAKAETNLIQNPDFEVLSGEDFQDWWASSACSSVEEANVYAGKYSLRLYDPDQSFNPYVAQSVSVIGGAEYRLSFYARKKSGSGEPLIKIEAYDENNTSVLQTALTGGKTAPNEWTKYEDVVALPSSAVRIGVLVRLLGNGEVFFDNISLSLHRLPDAFTLETDWVFYYSDMQTGTATAHVNDYFASYFSGGSVSFSLTGQNGTVLAEGTSPVVDGSASFSFPLRLLSVKKQAYTLSASLMDSGGTAADSKTVSVYKYDRPRYLGKDGLYLKNGTESIYPVFGYHCDPTQYAKVKEAGINILQGNLLPTAEGHLRYLDAALTENVMVLIPLYYNMKPAGHADNIERNTAIIKAIKDHPALFGYAIMDEPFLNFSNPEKDLEASYKLVRDLDDNHPVYTVEAQQSFYRTCSKYVDILGIDPYGAAYTGYVSDSTLKAREAVRNEKPVYVLLEAFRNNDGRYPTGQDERNMIYQALMNGADAIGYFSIADSEEDESGNRTIPIYDVPDMWNAITAFARDELLLSFDHFIFGKNQPFCQKKESTYQYAAWQKGGDIYLAVCGLQKDSSQEITIPLWSTAAKKCVDSFTAEVIQGSDTPPFSGHRNLKLTLTGTETLLIRITPENGFDDYYYTSFEDVHSPEFGGNATLTDVEAFSGKYSFALQDYEELNIFLPEVNLSDAVFSMQYKLIDSFETGELSITVYDAQSRIVAEGGPFYPENQWLTGYCSSADPTTQYTAPFSVIISYYGMGTAYIDDFSAYTTETIINGSFDMQTAEGNPGNDANIWGYNGGAWTNNSSYISLETKDGNTYVKMTGTPTSSYFYYRLYGLDYGTMYKLSYRTKTDHTQNTANAVTILAGDANTPGSSMHLDSIGRIWSPACSGTWTTHEVYFVNFVNRNHPLQNGRTYAEIRFAGNVGQAGVSAYFDDITLTPVSPSASFQETENGTLSVTYSYTDFFSENPPRSYTFFYRTENGLRTLLDVTICSHTPAAPSVRLNGSSGGTHTATGFLPYTVTETFSIPDTQNTASLSCEVVFWNKMLPSAKKAVYEIQSCS
ncbi:MAG: carbohydrate binding domain-containing protein [Clostridia bacterium]|nr:carbohydrate binding domain-containing protein [Clostridia bacterium]